VLTVLIVDDDAGVRRALRRGLERQAFNVLEAGDAGDGLLVVRRHREPIHALCTDSVMPGLPARQLIEGYRSTFPSGKVILWSGYSAPESNVARAADAFLHKPFSNEELARHIRRLVQ
jgi:DNA-binding NtrC family response regulator